MELVVILSKYVAMLSQQLQFFMLRTHQYRMYILYKPGPDLFIVPGCSIANSQKTKIRKLQEWA